MSKNQQDGNVEPSINIPPSNEPANLDYSQLLSARIKQHTAPPQENPPETEEPESKTEEEEEVASPVAEVEPAESEGIAGETEASELSEDVLSQIDLSKLSQEDIDKLRDVTQSRAVERFGQLTAARKAAEQERDRYRAELAKATQSKNPLETSEPVENNPFKDLNSVEELQEQWKQFNAVEEWADDVLDENEHASFDDIVTEHDGKELTKRQVKDYLKRAKQSKNKFLPARAEELQVKAAHEQLKVAFEDKAKTELPWFGNVENDINAEYERMIADKRVLTIAEKVPEVASQLNYLLAHAANSMLNLAKEKPTKQASRTVKPPSNPTGSSGSNDRPSERLGKKLKELENQYAESGSMRDFTSLRAEQIAKRYK